MKPVVISLVLVSLALIAVVPYLLVFAFNTLFGFGLVMSVRVWLAAFVFLLLLGPKPARRSS